MIDKQILVLWLVWVVGVSIVLLIISWSIHHDREVMKAGDQYIECVETNFHVSPAEYYELNGSYPECK